MSGLSNDLRTGGGAARRRWLGALLGSGAAALVRPARVLAQVTGTPGCDARAPLPARFRLDYVATAARGPLSLEGENELVFALDGRRYTLRSATRSVLFNAEQDSAGEINEALLVPHEYHEKSPRRPLRTTRVDWQAGRVSFSANEQEPAAVEPRLQDRLSLLLTAGQVLRAQSTKGAIVLPVAGVRHVSTYRFEYRGTETLELPAGRIDTHRIERPLNSEQDGVEVWYAPQLCWLPVRLRFADDRGQVVQNQLRAARFD